jgi:anaerobic C4-dicarboxylate transporter
MVNTAGLLAGLGLLVSSFIFLGIFPLNIMFLILSIVILKISCK